ncbi:MAG: leucine-rich repeat domain-containing protein [Mycoplasma sp.]
MRVKNLFKLVTSSLLAGIIFPVVLSINNQVNASQNTLKNEVVKNNNVKEEVEAQYTFNYLPDTDSYEITGCPNKETCTVANIPSYYQGKKVTKIAAHGLENCKAQKINFPANSFIQSIDTDGLKSMSNVQILELPSSVRQLGNHTLANMANLEKVILHEGLEGISSSCFEGDQKLSFINIPETATYIDSYAFDSIDIEHIAIPKSLKVFRDRSFIHLSKLSTITFNEDDPKLVKTISYDVVASGFSITTAFINQTNIDTEKSEELKTAYREKFVSGFRNAQWLTTSDIFTFERIAGENAVAITGFKRESYKNEYVNFNFPKTFKDPAITGGQVFKVKQISENLFQDAQKLFAINLSGIEIIGHDAFNGCRNLSQINFGSNITSIGENAFTNIGEISYIEWSNPDETKYRIEKNIIGGIQVGARIVDTKNESTTNKIGPTFQNLAYGDVYLQYHGNGQRQLDFGVLRNCTSVKSVKIENNPRLTIWIPARAFEGCTNLKTLILSWTDITRDFVQPEAFTGTSITACYIEQEPNSAINGTPQQRQAITQQYETRLRVQGGNFPENATIINIFDEIAPSHQEINYLGTEKTFEYNHHLGIGYINWVNQNPDKRITTSVQLEDITNGIATPLRNSRFINATSIVNFSFGQLIDRINLNKVPNIQNRTVKITPSISFQINDDHYETLQMSPFNINLTRNDDINAQEPEFHVNLELGNENRKGLWIADDRYTVQLEINKSYFGNNWNNASYIKNNFGNYWTCPGYGSWERTRSSEPEWINNRIGILSVNNFEDLTTKYRILISIKSTNETNQNYQNADVAFDFSYTDDDGSSVTRQLFQIHTYNALAFPVNIEDWTFNGDINFNFKGSIMSKTASWTLNKQTKYPNVPANFFDYLIRVGATITLDNQLNDNYFSVNDLNVTADQISVNVNLNRPNIDNYSISTGNKLGLTYNGARQFDLPSFNINSSTNRNISGSAVFNKNTQFANNRNGLWVKGDSYNATLNINKAFFGNDWNNPNNIKNNFDQYITFFNENRSKFNLTAVTVGNEKQWFNNEFGYLRVVSITPSASNPAIYQIQLQINKDINNQPRDEQFSNQTIRAKLSTDSANTQLFTLNTYSADNFKPEITTFNDVSNVTINFEQSPISTQTSIANTQNVDRFIANNNFAWYARNGYSFKLNSSGFSNPYIRIVDNSFNISENYTKFKVNVSLSNPSLQNIDVNVSGLKIIPYKGSFEDTPIAYPTFRVTSQKNDYAAQIGNTRKTYSSVLSNNRDGLWIPGDEWDIDLRISKAYFGNNWSNVEWIKQNFDQFITPNGVGNWTHTRDNLYLNNNVGQMEVYSIASTSAGSTTYDITLKFTVPNISTLTFADRDITFSLTNKAGNLFSIRTKAASDYDPGNGGISGRKTIVHFDRDKRNDTVEYQFEDQNIFKNLGNTNTLKWAVNKGYSLQIVTSDNEWISFDSNADFDIYGNVLSFGIHQNKPSAQDIEQITKSDLNVKIVDNHGQVVGPLINLPAMHVNIDHSEKTVQYLNFDYSNKKDNALVNQNDTVTFDVNIAKVLVQDLGANDSQLIRLIQMYYDNGTQNPSIWQWRAASSSGNVAKFVTQNGLDQYELTFTRILTNDVNDPINPLYHYRFTLKQLFTPKLKQDIIFKVQGANTNAKIKAKYIPVNTNQTAIILGASLAGSALGASGITYTALRRRIKDRKMFKK